MTVSLRQKPGHDPIRQPIELNDDGLFELTDLKIIGLQPAAGDA